MLDFDYVCGEACSVGLGRGKLDLFGDHTGTAGDLTVATSQGTSRAVPHV
jgi:hypothetical protein